MKRAFLLLLTIILLSPASYSANKKMVPTASDGENLLPNIFIYAIPDDDTKEFNENLVEYKEPNDVRVKVDVDPMYDDPVRNKILHPNGGVAYSYRYDIMYIGTMDQPNIFKCKIKGDTEYRGYQWG